MIQGKELPLPPNAKPKNPQAEIPLPEGVKKKASTESPSTLEGGSSSLGSEGDRPPSDGAEAADITESPSRAGGIDFNEIQNKTLIDYAKGAISEGIPREQALAALQEKGLSGLFDVKAEAELAKELSSSVQGLLQPSEPKDEDFIPSFPSFPAGITETGGLRIVAPDQQRPQAPSKDEIKSRERKRFLDIMRDNILSSIPEEERNSERLAQIEEQLKNEHDVLINLNPEEGSVIGEDKSGLFGLADFHRAMVSSTKSSFLTVNRLPYALAAQVDPTFKIAADVIEFDRSKGLEEAQKEMTQYEGDIFDDLTKGNFADAWKQSMKVTGESIPYMAAAAGASAVGGPVAGLAAMSSLSAANTYLDVKNEDWFKEMSPAEQSGFITVMGVAEGAGEYIGGRVLTRTIKQAAKNIGKDAAEKTLKDWFKGWGKATGISLKESALGEGVTGVVQDASIAFAKGEDYTFNDAIDSFKRNAVSGAGMATTISSAGASVSAPAMAYGSITARKYDKQIKEFSDELRNAETKEDFEVLGERVLKLKKEKNNVLKKEIPVFNQMPIEDSQAYAEAMVKYARLDIKLSKSKNEKASDDLRSQMAGQLQVMQGIEDKYMKGDEATESEVTPTQSTKAKKAEIDENISEQEYYDFINKGIVSSERIDIIARKIKDNVKLSDKETEIFNDKTADVNSRLVEIAELEATEEVTESESVPDAVNNLKDEEVVTLTYESLDEVPNSLKDLAKESKGGSVTIRKKVLGIPVGKEKTVTISGEKTFVVSATGKQIKDAAKQELAKSKPTEITESESATEDLSEAELDAITQIEENETYKKIQRGESVNEKEVEEYQEFLLDLMDKTDGTSELNSLIEDEFNTADSYDKKTRTVTEEVTEERPTGPPKRVVKFKEESKGRRVEGLLENSEVVVEGQVDGERTVVELDESGNVQLVRFSESGRRNDTETLTTNAKPSEVEFVSSNLDADGNVESVTLRVRRKQGKTDDAEIDGINFTVIKRTQDDERPLDIAIAAAKRQVGSVPQVEFIQAYEKVTKTVTKEVPINATQESSATQVPVGKQPATSQEVRAEDTQGEKTTQEGEVEGQIDNVANVAKVKPKNIKGLYDVNRKLFGLSRVKALASSVVMDRMIGRMAKRAGVSKSEMYNKISFEKASEKDLPQGVYFQKNKKLNLYHSTIQPIVGEFRMEGKNNSWGAYFARTKKASQTFGDITYKVSISPKNTLVVNDNEVRKIKFFNIPKDVFRKYIESGYDSIAWYKKGKLQEFVVLDPKIISNSSLLFQDLKGAMLAKDGNYIIYALTDPNVSTPLHELAHVYEHYLTDQERKDILAWAGHKEWTTETSEKFARGFEKYLSEGKAPTSGLQDIFNNFKEWLTEIYTGIVGSDIDVELNETMRSVYDQMIGTQEEQATNPAKEEVAKYRQKIKEGKGNRNDFAKAVANAFRKSKAKFTASELKNISREAAKVDTEEKLVKFEEKVDKLFTKAEKRSEKALKQAKIKEIGKVFKAAIRGKKTDDTAKIAIAETLKIASLKEMYSSVNLEDLSDAEFNQLYDLLMEYNETGRAKQSKFNKLKQSEAARQAGEFAQMLEGEGKPISEVTSRAKGETKEEVAYAKAVQVISKSGGTVRVGDMFFTSKNKGAMKALFKVSPELFTDATVYLAPASVSKKKKLSALKWITLDFKTLLYKMANSLELVNFANKISDVVSAGIISSGGLKQHYYSSDKINRRALNAQGVKLTDLAVKEDGSNITVKAEGVEDVTLTVSQVAQLYMMLSRVTTMGPKVVETIGMDSALEVIEYVKSTPPLLNYIEQTYELYEESRGHVNIALEKMGQKPILRKAIGKSTTNEMDTLIAALFDGNPPEFEPYAASDIKSASEQDNTKLFMGDQGVNEKFFADSLKSLSSGGVAALSGVQENLKKYVEQTAHMVAMADAFVTMSNVFNRNNMRLINNRMGAGYESMLRAQINDIMAGRVVSQSGVSKWEKNASNIVRRQAAVQMFFNVRSALNQWTSVTNNMVEHLTVKEALIYMKYVMKMLDPTNKTGMVLEFARLDAVARRPDEKGASEDYFDYIGDEKNRSKMGKTIDEVLSKGYVLTSKADFAAVIYSGAPLYKMRLDTLIKNNKENKSLDELKNEAAIYAMTVAEEVQQSQKIYTRSALEKSPIGRYLYTFVKVSLQYSRRTQQAWKDLMYGRGDRAMALSRVIYYGAVQNLIFQTMSNMTVFLFTDDDDEEVSMEKRRAWAGVLNKTLDSFLIGYAGLYGLLAAKSKNLLFDVLERKLEDDVLAQKGGLRSKRASGNEDKTRRIPKDIAEELVRAMQLLDDKQRVERRASDVKSSEVITGQFPILSIYDRGIRKAMGTKPKPKDDTEANIQIAERALAGIQVSTGAPALVLGRRVNQIFNGVNIAAKIDNLRVEIDEQERIALTIARATDFIRDYEFEKYLEEEEKPSRSKRK